MAIVKNVNGEVVKVMQTNKKPGSKMYGYCGQDLKNGVFAVYVNGIGICSVEKSNEPETVVFIENFKNFIALNFKMISL